MAPPLPPVVLQPLQCPLEKCRYPGEPLLPESTFKLAVALEKLFSAVVRHQVRVDMGETIRRMTLLGTAGGETGEIVDMVIMGAVVEGQTSTQILQSSKGPDGRRRVGLVLQEHCAGFFPTVQTALGLLSGGLQSIPDFYHYLGELIPLASNQLCLHDYTTDSPVSAPQVITNAAAALHEYILHPLADFEATDLLKRVAKLLKGDWKAQWEPWMGEQWKGKIAEAARGYSKIVEAMLLDQLLGEQYIGSFRFFAKVCPPIKLLSFLIKIDNQPLVAIETSLARSEEGRQLVGLIATLPSEWSKILARIPASAFPPIPKYSPKSKGDFRNFGRMNES